MPERMDLPDFPKMFAKLAEEVRTLQRHTHPFEDQDFVDVEQLPAYSWQSAFNLTVGLGLRLYADRAGRIVYCRAERSSGDGTTTATLDVLKNGTSIFTTATKPTVPAAEFLGAERVPDILTFAKGDYFRIEIEATGGGTGPLRLTIRFEEPK